MTETRVEIESLIRTKDFAKLREELGHLRPQEIAAVLAALRADDQVLAFRILPRRLAASVFEYLSADQQGALVKAMGQEDVAALLNQMSPDDRTMFLSELPANVTKPLLALLTPEERTEAVALLGWPPTDEASSCMTTIQPMAIQPIRTADTPPLDQGDAVERPIPAPRARSASDRAAATKAPASTAAQDTPDECPSFLPVLDTEVSCSFLRLLSLQSGLG